MNDDRLGEPVTVADISDAPIQAGLPHPQDPWSNAPGMDKPFTGAAVPAGRNLGAETAYDPRGRDPMYEAQEARTAAPPVTPGPLPKPAQKTRPVPLSSNKATRKETSTLKRFREVFGLQRISVIDAVLLRRDPADATKNVEMTFGLRGINFEDYQWVLDKTQEITQSPSLVMFAWKIAFMSMGVASIEGEPVWKVLGFEPENPEHVRDPMYPHMGLRFQAAEALCEELRTTLFDTVENLYSSYEAKVDSTYLPKKEVPVEEVKEEGPQVPLQQSGSRS